MLQSSFSFAVAQSSNALLVRDVDGQYRVASADEVLSQATRYWPSTSRTSSAFVKRASVEETAKENEDCDMRNSGLDWAGLPETESLTSQRSGQGSKTTEGRKRAPRARADLDGENDVIRWVYTATHTPTPPALPFRQAKRAGLGWPGR